MERKRQGKLRQQEELLAAHVAELRADLTACRDTRTAAKLASSLGEVKTAEQYAKDRENILDSYLQVDISRTLVMQCEEMSKECEMCSQLIYTTDDLPNILQQFYTEKVGELVQLKHLLLVRWARFATNNHKLSEKLYSEFQQRIQYVMCEYNDSLHRARRFSRSPDTSNKTKPTVTINNDDVMIYLRWLVTHQHNTKSLSSFLSTIGWLPALYHNELMNITKSSGEPPQPPPPPYSSSPSSSPSLSKLKTASSKWLKEKGECSTPRTGSRTGSTYLINHLHDDSTSHISRDHMTRSTQQSATLPSSLGGGGEGVANQSVGVVSTSLPLHKTRASELKDILQQLMLIYGIQRATPIGSSEELQLFYDVSRKFNSLHTCQVPRPSPYDSVPSSTDETQRGRGKVGGGGEMFTKPANWVEFRELIIEPDPVQIIGYAKIRDNTEDIDPLLSLSSLTSHLHSPQRAMTALKQHAVTVKQPSLLPLLSSSSSSSYLPTPSNLQLVWRSLYSGLDNRNPMDTRGVASAETMETGSSSEEHGPLDPTMNVKEATRVMSNKKGRGVSAMATSVTKDTYLSYLLLRHLHIRDKRTEVQSVLNYFRSVERTLTINHRGLSMESGQQHPTASSTLVNHRHLHNNPADYMLSETKFMEYSEVENHDDYYQFHTPSQSGIGLVQVTDPLGTHIIYDIAIDDLTEIERELLVIGTYYIESGSGSEAKDMAGYSRRDIDRMAVLHDLWTSEARFHDNKMKLVNCYLECYHNTTELVGRERLAKVILTLMKARPNYDTDSAYFTTTFDLECRILDTHCRLVRSIVEVVMEEERCHCSHIWEGHRGNASEKVFGMGLPPPTSHPVSLTGQTLLLPPSSLLQTLPSLSLLSSLPHSIQLALNQLPSQLQTTVTNLLKLHLKLLEVASDEWTENRTLGTGFSNDVIDKVFSGVCIEDGQMVSDIGERWVVEKKKQEGDGGGKHDTRLKALCELLELVTVRHHLLLTSSLTSLLTRHYKQLLSSLGHDECHSHLRCVTIDPTAKTPTEQQSLESFVTHVKEKNLSTILDRYVPNKASLAILELDDKQLTNFSFKSQESIIELLRNPTGLQRVQTALKTEVVHKWTLATSSLINTAVLTALEGAKELNVGVLGSQKYSKNVKGLDMTASDIGKTISVQKTLKKAFVSVQLEKMAVRDHMLSGLVSKIQSAGRGRSGIETVKCVAVGEFCDNIIRVMSQYSLRHQILQLYNNLLNLLNTFPATRDGYFIVGKEAQHQNTIPPYVKDTRSMLSRPPVLLTEDGSQIRNLWYIPTTIEVLTMFSDGVTINENIKNLKTVLSLVSPLLAILQYHVAYTRLSCSYSVRRVEEERVGGGWGGTEGIGNVIQKIQNDISDLPDPSDPTQVTEYLQLTYDLLYYQHSLTIKHYLKRTFLLHGNHSAVGKICSTSIPTVSRLCHTTSPHSSYLTLSLPFVSSTDKSNHLVNLYPWKQFRVESGSTPSLPDQFPREIGNTVMAGLAVLTHAERMTANGEILGLSLLLEEEFPSSISTPHPSQIGLSPSHSTTLTNKTTPIIARAKMIKEFLILSLQLESLRWVWSLQLVGGASSSLSQSQIKDIDQTFQERVVGVARIQVAKQMTLDQTKLSLETDVVDESISHSNTFLTEVSVSQGGATKDSFTSEHFEHISERKLRNAQLRLLQERLQMGLIKETLQQLATLHHLVLLEQNRDQSTLPLDLWKMNPSMKEPTGVSRPHLVESFLSLFNSNSTDSGPNCSISKTRLMECVYQLSSDVLHREKETLQMYTGHYEGLIRSLYYQLYQRDRQLEMMKEKAESVANDSHIQTLVTAGELTHSQLLELTALRVRIKELEKQLKTQEEELRNTIQKEYSSLTHNLLSSCTAITTRYHDYRESIFTDVLKCVSEVRTSAAEAVTRAKESRGDHTTKDIAIAMTIQAEEVCRVQKENTKYTNLMLKQRTMNSLQRTVRKQRREREVEERTEECEEVRRGALEEKTAAEMEIKSLQSQLNILKRRLGAVEKERDAAILELREKSESAIVTTTAKPSASKKQLHLMRRDAKVVNAKMKKLVGELEEKEKMIGDLESVHNKQHRREEEGNKRLSNQLQVTKQQLDQERQLKKEAFHQVDDLLTQVHDLEDAHHSPLQALATSTRASTRTPSSTPHTPPHHSSKHTITRARPHSSTHQRLHTPNSAGPDLQRRHQQRPRSKTRGSMSRDTTSRPSTSSSHHNRETIDVSQDILALKLI